MLTILPPAPKQYLPLNKTCEWGFPGGAVVMSPPSNAGDTGLISSQGTKIPHAAGQLCPHTLEAAHRSWRACVGQLLNPHALEPVHQS